MKVKPKIYLETTIFNYYFLIDPEREIDIFATKQLFDEIKNGTFEAFTSALTIGEIEKCNDTSLKKKMLGLIEVFNIGRLALRDFPDYEDLAEKYILAGAIPVRKKGDAFHIAIATLSGMDILASWNCDHIVRFKTQQIVKTINIVEGLTDIAINIPREVIGYEKKT